MTSKRWMAGLLLLGLASCGDTGSPGSTAPPGDGDLAGTSFVLVHGAWMGAWAWDAVATGLHARGATVTAVELPGHGEDQTPVPGATLDAYVAKVDATIDAAVEAAPGQLIVVGHSMAGMVITQAAEQRADKIDQLVYLAAYVPNDGQTLQDLSATDATSHVGPVIQIDMTSGLAGIPRDQLQDVFCADCAPAQLDMLATHYRDEPLPAFLAPVHVTAGNWGRIAKYYIHTAQDHAVSPELQQTMTAGTTWVRTATLDTSHAPFLSQPARVVDTLAGFAGPAR